MNPLMAPIRPKVAIMRRFPNGLAAKLGAVGLLALGSPDSNAQDDLGVLVRPPAEVHSTTEIHPAPPAPTLPAVAPGPVAAEVPGPSLAIGPANGMPPRRLSSTLGTMDRPPIDEPGVSIRPPLSLGPGTGTEFPSPGESSFPVSTSIAPPILPDSEEIEALNPLLPPGPSTRDPIASPVRSHEGNVPKNRNMMSPERRQPGLLGGLFKRFERRPSPPAAPIVSRVGGPDKVIEPDDPAANEAIRHGIERAIISREAERIASVEVMIAGRRVHIQAEAARPWQRWSLRRGLESLPMPEGYQSSIEVR